MGVLMGRILLTVALGSIMLTGLSAQQQTVIGTWEHCMCNSGGAQPNERAEPGRVKFPQEFFKAPTVVLSISGSWLRSGGECVTGNEVEGGPLRIWTSKDDISNTSFQVH